MEVAGLTAGQAAAICTWTYPPPYSTYDLTGTDPGFLLDPENGYVALVDGGELVGYRLFGPDGRVPGAEYATDALDTGGGLRPDLTGRGLGRPALAVGLAYGRARYAPAAFRVTVAAWNARALRVVRAAGFEPVGAFAGARDGTRYDVLVRPERPSARSTDVTAPPSAQMSAGSAAVGNIGG